MQFGRPHALLDKAGERLKLLVGQTKVYKHCQKTFAILVIPLKVQAAMTMCVVWQAACGVRQGGGTAGTAGAPAGDLGDGLNRRRKHRHVWRLLGLLILIPVLLV